MMPVVRTERIKNPFSGRTFTGNIVLDKLGRECTWVMDGYYLLKMFYWNAKALVEAAIEAKILHSCEKDGNRHALMYRSGGINPEGWYWVDIEIAIHELMESEEGQDLLIKALQEKRVELPKFYQPYKCNGCSHSERVGDGLFRCKKEFQNCDFL